MEGPGNCSGENGGDGRGEGVRVWDEYRVRGAGESGEDIGAQVLT